MAFGRNSANVDIHATDKTARAIASAQKNLKGFGSSAKSIMGGLGVGLGASAFVGLAKGAIEYGSSLTDAAIATSTNVEALQALRYAAQEAGASQQNLDNALIRISKSTYDAQRGLSTAKDAFKLLNINVEEFAKLPTERKMEVLAKSMANASDQGQATGAAMDLLGTRNAPKLMEALQWLARDGFDPVYESARAAGQMMSEDVAKSMDGIADAMASIKTGSLQKMSGLLVDVFSIFSSNLDIDIAATTREISYLQATVDDINANGNAGRYWDVWSLSMRTFAQDLEEAKEKLAKLTAERDKDVVSTTDLTEAQNELNAALASAPDLASDKTEERLGNLVRQLSELRAGPENVIKILRHEIDLLQKSLRKMQTDGLSGTEDFAKLQIEAIQKAIKLHGLESRAAEESRRVQERAAREKKQQTEDARRALEDTLSDLGLSDSDSAAKKKALNPDSISEKQAREREDRLVKGGTGFSKYYDYLNPMNDPANIRPAIGAEVAVSDSPLGPAGSVAEDAAAESIKAGMEKGTSSLEQIEKAVVGFVERLALAEQQIADAR